MGYTSMPFSRAIAPKIILTEEESAEGLEEEVEAGNIRLSGSRLGRKCQLDFYYSQSKQARSYSSLPAIFSIAFRNSDAFSGKMIKLLRSRLPSLPLKRSSVILR